VPAREERPPVRRYDVWDQLETAASDTAPQPPWRP
jgi:hypothetical protein